MNTPCCLVSRLGIVVALVLPSLGYAQEVGSPAGIKSEQSLPSRYGYVIADMLKFCQPKNGYWVDLGAGKGQVAIPLVEKTGNPVTMLDPDAAGLAEGLEAAREKGLQDKLFAVVGVAEKLPFPDNSVDLVVSRGSIFFWEDPAQGLREVYRVLRPGAKAYIGGGAGSGYPQEAVAALIDERKKQRTGDEAEKWQRFVELRRPEQMQRWAEAAGLPQFEVMGKGAISAEDERVGQGVWVVFQKQPEIRTRKDQDRITARVQGESTIYTIVCPSGIGGATISPWNGWAKKVVLRLKLGGLESLTVSNGQVELRASVLSHSGHARLLSLKGPDGETKIEPGSPQWTKIDAFDARGKPLEGLPAAGGWFEIGLPQVLFDGQPKTLTIEWIDFYRQ